MALVKLPVAPPHPVSELLLYLATPLLTQLLVTTTGKVEEDGPGTCAHHPCVNTGWSSMTLNLAWPTLAVTDIWRANWHMEGISNSLCRFAFQINKSNLSMCMCV